MTKKHIIITVLVLLLLAIFFWPTGDFKIAGIEDGNIVRLNNGTQVKLIGISATVEGKEYLEDQFLERPVFLLSDSSAPFNPNNLDGHETIYAYVLDKHRRCINSELLRLGLVELQEGTYLKDSLRKFRSYAQSQGEKKPLTPTPTPVINYEEDDIILPEFKYKNERRHNCWYVDGNLNIDMLKEACDYNLPYTKSFANDLAGRSQGPFNPGQICEIFDYCYNKWRYVNDPKGQEYVACASESIACNLSGDCDDFAVLMASCMLAIGGDACVNSGYNPGGGHAFTEVDISGFNKTVVLDVIREHFKQYNIKMLHTRQDGNHLWLNLDWQAAYPGGPYYDCSNGRSAYPCVNGQWHYNKLI